MGSATEALMRDESPESHADGQTEASPRQYQGWETTNAQLADLWDILALIAKAHGYDKVPRAWRPKSFASQQSLTSSEATPKGGGVKALFRRLSGGGAGHV